MNDVYELLKQNDYRGLSCNLIRTFLAQMIDAIQVPFFFFFFVCGSVFVFCGAYFLRFNLVAG